MSADAPSGGVSAGGARDRVRSGSRRAGPGPSDPDVRSGVGGAVRRRTSDWVRVVVAVAAITLLVAYHDNPSDANLDLFRFFNGLPDDLRPLFQTLYWAGTLWGVGGRRGRTDRASYGWRAIDDRRAARCVARALGLFVADQGLSQTSSTRWTRLDKSPALPVGTLAIVAAIIGAAVPLCDAPDTTRWGGARGRAGLSAMYLGTGYPSDVLAALFLGWGVAALVHLVFGSPGGRPTTAPGGGVTGGDRCGGEGCPFFPRTDRLSRCSSRATTAAPVGTGHRPRRGRQSVLRQVVALAGVQGFRFPAVPDPRAGRRARGVHPCCSRSGRGSGSEVVVAGTAGPGAALRVAGPSRPTKLADLAPDAVTDDLLGSVAPGARAARGADRPRCAEHAQRRWSSTAIRRSGTSRPRRPGRTPSAGGRPRRVADVHRGARR